MTKCAENLILGTFCTGTLREVSLELLRVWVGLSEVEELTLRYEDGDGAGVSFLLAAAVKTMMILLLP